MDMIWITFLLYCYCCCFFSCHCIYDAWTMGWGKSGNIVSCFFAFFFVYLPSRICVCGWI